MTDRIPWNATDEERFAYEERAAIMQYDGELSKEDAERNAAADIWPETEA